VINSYFLTSKVELKSSRVPQTQSLLPGMASGIDPNKYQVAFSVSKP